MAHAGYLASNVCVCGDASLGEEPWNLRGDGEDADCGFNYFGHNRAAQLVREAVVLHEVLGPLRHMVMQVERCGQPVKCRVVCWAGDGGGQLQE